MAKRVNKCPSYDKHWGCAISPTKHCSGCPDADWQVEIGDERLRQHTITEDFAWQVYNVITRWKAGEFGEYPLQDVLDKEI